VKRVVKKKAAKKKTARGRAKARAAQQPVRKAAAKRTVRKASRKAAATAHRLTAKKTPRRSAPGRSRAKPVLRVAPRPAPRVAASTDVRPASFPQRAGASEKLTVLFEMARARTAVLAAIQGLVPGSAEQPHAEGKWNTRQHVLHLAHCDQVYAADIELALRGVTPAAATYTKEDDDRVNAEALERLNHLSWDEALRLLHTARQRLLEALETVAEDAGVWTPPHMFGRILRSAALHDRHHADVIKRWRTESRA
jgi:uncharacterized damage-inducible protein DinB